MYKQKLILKINQKPIKWSIYLLKLTVQLHLIIISMTDLTKNMQVFMDSNFHE